MGRASGVEPRKWGETRHIKGTLILGYGKGKYLQRRACLSDRYRSPNECDTQVMQ